MENFSLTSFVVIIVAVPLVVAVVGAMLASRLDRGLGRVSVHFRHQSEERENAPLSWPFDAITSLISLLPWFGFWLWYARRSFGLRTRRYRQAFKFALRAVEAPLNIPGSS